MQVIVVGLCLHPLSLKNNYATPIRFTEIRWSGVWSTSYLSSYWLEILFLAMWCPKNWHLSVSVNSLMSLTTSFFFSDSEVYYIALHSEPGNRWKTSSNTFLSCFLEMADNMHAHPHTFFHPPGSCVGFSFSSFVLPLSLFPPLSPDTRRVGWLWLWDWRLWCSQQDQCADRRWPAHCWPECTGNLSTSSCGKYFATL